MERPECKVWKNSYRMMLYRDSLKVSGKKLVVTNGCFDILHRGHVEYLYKARLQGDALLVLLNGDISVKLLKGAGRPINNEIDRATILSSLYFVDAVYIFNAKRCDVQLGYIQPDIYVKGGDYNLNNMDKDEKNILRSVGAKIKFIEMVKNYSTTNLIERMK